MSKKVNSSNSLETMRPDLIDEWHPKKNIKRPSDYHVHSAEKVWWLGKCGHEWDASIKNRTVNNSGCPYCANQKILPGFNDLETKYPKLAEEWHPTKNNGISPRTIAPRTNTKYWWIGKCGHEFDASPDSRVDGNGCPFCAGKRVLKGFNDLQSMYPEIAKDFLVEENGNITADQVIAKSGKKYKWICPKGHIYESTPVRRTNDKNGCPYCSGRERLIGYNDLATVNPMLANEWHPTKNGDLKPNEVAPNSSKKVWWLCRTCGNEWKAAVSNRNHNKSRCPSCFNQSSFSEQAIAYYLESADKKVENRNKDYGYELDIYLPNEKVAIEYDGIMFHKNENKLKKDVEKNNKCIKDGIKLYRIRENGLPNIDYSINIIRKDDSLNSLNLCIKSLFELLRINEDINVERDELKILERYKKRNEENSIAALYPNLLNEWHPTRNGNLKPKNFTKGSATKVWWLGKCGHEWQATVASRCAGAKCRVCADKNTAQMSSIPILGQSFGDKYPELVKEWSEKNERSPYDYKPGSGLKVLWKCYKCGNEWESRINDRARGHGCKKCSDKEKGINRAKPKKGESFAELHPELIKEWKETNRFSPYEIKATSKVEISWVCERCGYNYSSTPYMRHCGSGCIKCSRQSAALKRSKPEKGKSFGDLHPELLAEWSPKNEKSPFDYKPGSKVKVEWICNKCGHKWKSAIVDRNQGHGCKVCGYKKISEQLRNRRKNNV